MFPVEEIRLNTSTLEREIERDVRRLPPNAGFEQFMAELPSEQMRQRIRQKVTAKVDNSDVFPSR